MPNVFLSYRRDDSIDVAGRIHDRLAAHFGHESVFVDVDSIPYGVDFRAYLEDWISRCDVLLAVVGEKWLDARDEQGRVRLGDPADFVTIEVSAALGRGIPVIPVLVGRAQMPKVHQLPEALGEFAFRNAAEVRSGRDFHSHMDRLIRGIESQKPVTRSAGSEPSTDPQKVSYVAVEPPAVATPVNLGFDDATVDGMPPGWFDSAGFVSGVSTRYAVDVVPRDDGAAGTCLRLQAPSGSEKEFGALMQRVPVHNLVGGRVRVAAEIRAAGLTAWASLWVRIDGQSRHLFFDNMHDRPITGTTPWATYVIESDIPARSEWLNYGVLLSGNGTVWADNFRIHGI